MNPIILTIIVPVYNVEEYLKDCLDSILENDFSDYELILIDDGSTDKSGIICDEYASENPKTKVIHQKNFGQSIARNVGLDIAQGEFVSFIDSDDKISKDLYSSNIPILMANKNIDALEFPVDVDVQRGVMNSQQYILGHKNILNYWINVIGRTVIWCRIYRKSVFDHLRFPEGMLYEDTYITPLLANKMEYLYVSSKGLYYYNMYNVSTMRSAMTASKVLDRLEADLQIMEQRFFFWPDTEKTMESYYAYCMKYYVYKGMNFSVDCSKYKEFIFNHMPSYISVGRSKLAIKAKIILFFIKVFKPENVSWMLKLCN